MKTQIRNASKELIEKHLKDARKKGEYELQAMQFLIDTKTDIEIKFLRKGRYFEGDKEVRNIYAVILKNDNHEYYFQFGDSIHNTEQMDKVWKPNQKNKFKPKAYSVLSCLNIDFSEDFKDFCDNFGYSACDKDNFDGNFINEASMKVYRAVQEETKNLQLLFNEEQQEKLHEIA